MNDLVIPSTATNASSMSADQLMGRFRITKEDLELVREFGKTMKPKIETFVDQFYDWLGAEGLTDEFFIDERHVVRTRELQIDYWNAFFDGVIDDAFVETRRKIGRVHARIELPLDVYMAAMSISFENCVDVLFENIEPSENSRRTMLAISKLMHLDEMITADTYSQITNETLLEQSKSMIEMSTPVTAIWDDILMLPLVGIIDSKRALDVTARVLEEIGRTQSSCFILDISGVAIIDTAVANYLIKITKACRLMGCEPLISGLSPAIAQTIVNLGIDVGSIQTTGNLREALKLAFKHIGMTVTDA